MTKIYKIIIKWAVCLAVLVASTGCVEKFRVGDAFLEKQPGVDVNIDLVFSKAEYARRFLWEKYSALYTPWYYHMNGGQIDALSDCVHSTLQWDVLARTYYSGAYNASVESSSVDGYDNRCRPGYIDKTFRIWSTVRGCWIFIENVDRVPDMDQSEKDRLKAEAKIIIASKYFDSFQNLGGMLIIDHAYGPSEKLEEARSTVEETVDFMVRLCDEAIAEPNLPWRIKPAEIENWEGRMTKGAASSLKCKILLFAASPLFNNDQPYTTEAPQEAVEKRYVWYGNYDVKRWQACLEACEEFFNLNNLNGNAYALVQPKTRDLKGYRRAFFEAYHNRGNSEGIMDIHYYDYLRAWDFQVPGNTTHYGAAAPTVDYMEMFCNADGTPFTGQSVYNTDNPENIDIFENRDPRLYETMMVQKKDFMYQGKQIDICQNSKSTLYGTDGMFAWGKNSLLAHGVGSYKFVLDYNMIGDERVKFPYTRMSEMYYIYAEALAETGNLSKACEQINIVRDRVGLGKIEECNPDLNLTTDKDNLIDEILRERACEFGYEAKRFYDMTRRMLVKDFTKHLRAIKIYRKDEKAQSVPITELGKYPDFRYEVSEITASPSRVWWEDNYWTNKWLLTAFPDDEVNKGYGLIQNPGW